MHFEWWVFSSWDILGSIILMMLTIFRWFFWFIKHTIPAICTYKSSYYSLHSWTSGWKTKQKKENRESIKQKHSFFKKIIYFWLRWVFVALRGRSLIAVRERGLLFIVVCGLLIGGFSCCGAWALCMQASVVVVCGLSSCGARA